MESLKREVLSGASKIDSNWEKGMVKAPSFVGRWCTMMNHQESRFNLRLTRRAKHGDGLEFLAKFRALPPTALVVSFLWVLGVN